MHKLPYSAIDVYFSLFLFQNTQKTFKNLFSEVLIYSSGLCFCKIRLHLGCFAFFLSLVLSDYNYIIVLRCVYLCYSVLSVMLYNY